MNYLYCQTLNLSLNAYLWQAVVLITFQMLFIYSFERLVGTSPTGLVASSAINSTGSIFCLFLVFEFKIHPVRSGKNLHIKH